jgi:predicted RNA-binding protein with PUA-like domain
MKYVLFDIAPAGESGKMLTLADVKADGRFAEFDLVTQSRLSVMPVPKRIDGALRKMAGL